jgi:hypothetical protein
MSQVFLVSFFPSVTNILQRRFPDAFDHFFPTSVGKMCPEFRLQITCITATKTIRNPVLGVGAIVGIFIGFFGAAMILHDPRVDDELSTEEASKRNPSSCNQRDFSEVRYIKRCHKNNTSLRFFAAAFLFFGLMNLFALPLHCLVSSPSNISSQSNILPQEYAILWVFDFLMTGWSAMALTIGCDYDTICNQSESASLYHLPPLKDMKLWNKYILIGAITSFLTLLTFKSYNITIGIELMYLLPVVTAATKCCTIILKCSSNYFCKSFVKRKSKLSRGHHVSSTIALGCTISGLGILSLIIGIAFDAAACKNLGQSWGDAFMAPTVTFWGCDLVFLGLLICLEGQTEQKLVMKRDY